MKKKPEEQNMGYTVVEGLRCVKPYIFVFRCGAKGRWFKRAILDVFLEEFGAYPPGYYRESIRIGTILVNDEKVEPTYLLRNGDKVIHKTHRHEPPVTAKEIEVVHEDENVLVVDKPPTIPMHPCGAYRFNTLTSILTYERPDLHLHLIYRLDRLVSGLTILAKSPAAARQFSHELQAGQTQKVYLARVIGDLSKTDRFPAMAEPAVVSTGSVEGEEEGSSGGDWRLPEILFEQWLTEKPKRKGRPRELGRMEGEEEKGKHGKKRRKGKAGEALEGEPGEDEEDEEEEDVPMEWRRQSDGSILVRTGIRCVSFREGVQECSVRGKPSITVLRVRSFDGETSVVECRPVTGRTHQIRLHLQWLGHPIANDPNYGDEAAVEAYAKKYRLAEREAHDKDYRYADGKRAEEEEEGKEQPAVTLAEGEKEETQTAVKGAPSDGMDVASEVADVGKEETEEERIERVCPHCATGGLSHFRAQQLRHEGIWLHAWRYRGKAWSYETPLPEWAKEHGAGAEARGAEEGAEPSAQITKSYKAK